VLQGVCSVSIIMIRVFFMLTILHKFVSRLIKSKGQKFRVTALSTQHLNFFLLKTRCYFHENHLGDGCRSNA
jgi:hypothetical protein